MGHELYMNIPHIRNFKKVKRIHTITLGSFTICDVTYGIKCLEIHMIKSKCALTSGIFGEKGFYFYTVLEESFDQTFIECFFFFLVVFHVRKC